MMTNNNTISYKWRFPKYTVLCIIAIQISLFSFSQTPRLNGGNKTIRPGAVWTDNNGNLIQAHGGGIIKVGDVFYWFGEDRSKDSDPTSRYAACYASTDLLNWTFKNRIRFAAPSGIDSLNWIFERPKVYYNKATDKYVMYFHLDQMVDRKYKVAEMGVAISDSIDRGYKIVNHYRPFGMESRDIGQFVDDDGTAYIIFESRPVKGFFIARLSDDYLNVEEKICFIKEPFEGGAIVRYKGLYYLIGSHLTGWRPNPNVYATANSLSGPWSSFENIAPKETNTYGSQSTFLLKIVGNRETTVIYMGDIWNPQALWDSRYLWMPVEIGNGKLYLPEPRPWSIDTRTGKVRFRKKIKETFK